MKCERYQCCPFFNNRIQYASVIMENYQKTLCSGEFTRCARYVVFKVLGDVPADLYPNMHDKATELIITDLANND